MADTPHIPNETETRARSAVTPAKAGADTRWLVAVSAGGGVRKRTSVRIGPGLRRGDVGVSDASTPLWIGRSRRAAGHGFQAEGAPRQILPIGVPFLNQPDFPIAMPFLDQFLPVDGGADMIMHFKPYQPLDAICLCEAAHNFVPMFNQAAGKVVCNAGVKGAISAAGQDIDKACHRMPPLSSSRRRPGPIRSSLTSKAQMAERYKMLQCVWAPAFAGVTRA